MPEALALVAVFFIAVAIYIGMWMQTRDPALHKPHEELARMQQQVKWLEERFAVARKEKWGAEMVGSIEAELEMTVGQLAKANATQAVRTAGGVVPAR